MTRSRGWRLGAALVSLLAASMAHAQRGDPVDSAGRDPYAGFGLALFRTLTHERANANVFLAPASAAFALAMTADGAAGSTRTAMLSTLGLLDAASDSLSARNAVTIASLTNQSAVQLRIANSIWAAKGRTFVPTFFAGAQRWYGAELKTLPLATPEAQGEINAWVRRATLGKIAGILDQPLPDSTVMVLLDAIYFKGSWTTAFDAKLTRAEPFAVAGGTRAPRSMMHRTGDYQYLRDSGLQALRLPYKGGRMAMYVFLPDSGTPLARMNTRFDAIRWQRWMHGFRFAHVELALPRFRIEWSKDLTGTLADLGMRIAFDPNTADFSRLLARSGRVDTHVFIGKVLQKTFVEVNEEGAEAAAVTGVIMAVPASVPPPPLRFEVDRPFVVAIVDDRTGTILFIGQIVDPHA